MYATTGVIYLEGGKFLLGGANVITAGSNLAVIDGATLDLNGHADTVTNLTLATGAITSSSPTTLTATGTFTAGGVPAGTIGGMVTVAAPNPAVTGGTLLVNGTLTSTAVTPSTTVVSTLGGGVGTSAGTVNGPVLVSGIVSPGAPTAPPTRDFSTPEVSPSAPAPFTTWT